MYKPPIINNPYNGREDDRQPNAIVAPPIVRIDVEASKQWYDAVGDTRAARAQQIIDSHAGSIDQFFDAQTQQHGLGIVEVHSAEMSFPDLTVQLSISQGTSYLTLKVYPENSSAQPGTLDIGGEYTVDIPFQGYPVTPGTINGYGGTMFSAAPGGIGALNGAGITAPSYFEVEIVLLPIDTPPSNSVAGDFSHDGLTLITDAYEFTVDGATYKYPMDLNTFCSPFVGIGVGPKQPGAVVKGSTVLGGGFIGSGSNGFPRSIIAFPAQCRYSTLQAQTFKSAVYWLGDAEIYYTGFESDAWVPYITAKPGATNDTYLVGNQETIGDEYAPAYTTPDRAASLQTFTGVFGVNNTIVWVLSYNNPGPGFRWDGADFPVSSMQSVWTAYMTELGTVDDAVGIALPGTSGSGIPSFPPTNPTFAYFGSSGTVISASLNLRSLGIQGDFLPVGDMLPQTMKLTAFLDPLKLDSVTIDSFLILGDVFTGPTFKYQDYVSTYSWGAFINQPTTFGNLYFPDLITVGAGPTEQLSGPNTLGVHSWVIKGIPTHIGNLNHPLNDLPINNTALDQYGNAQDATGVWTGVDLGPPQVGDIIMVAVQPATKTNPGGAWFGKNGEWKGSKPGLTPDAVLDDLTSFAADNLCYYPIAGAQRGHTTLKFRYGNATKYGAPSGFTGYGMTTIITS